MFLSTRSRSPLRSGAVVSENRKSQFGQTTWEKWSVALPVEGRPTWTVYPQRGQAPSRWCPMRAGAMLPVGTPNGSTASVRMMRNNPTKTAITTRSKRTGLECRVTRFALGGSAAAADVGCGGLSVSRADVGGGVVFSGSEAAEASLVVCGGSGRTGGVSAWSIVRAFRRTNTEHVANGQREEIAPNQNSPSRQSKRINPSKLRSSVLIRIYPRSLRLFSSTTHRTRAPRGRLPVALPPVRSASCVSYLLPA